MGLPIRREDIVRIEAIELPLEFKKGEGLYTWKHMTDDYFLDVFDLKRDLEDKAPAIVFVRTPHLTKDLWAERVLDRLQNFRKVYLNLATGEVST